MKFTVLLHVLTIVALALALLGLSEQHLRITDLTDSFLLIMLAIGIWLVWNLNGGRKHGS